MTVSDGCLHPIGSLDENEIEWYEFKQYIVPSGEDYVEIVLKCYRHDNHSAIYMGALTGISLVVDIEYRFVPQEMMKTKLDEAEKLKQKKDNDL